MAIGTSDDVDSDGVSPFRVLGIALIIDQLGKEARMAFRYPSSLARYDAVFQNSIRRYN